MLHEHGGDIYACRMECRPDTAGGQIPEKHSEIRDFSANINFRGMPEAVRNAAERAVSGSVHYPDPECRRLRTALAERETVLLRKRDDCFPAGPEGHAHGDSRAESEREFGTERIRPFQIICGNGAAELMFALAAAYRPRRALLAVPSFFEYEQALAAFGCEIRRFALREDRDFQLGEDFADAIDEETDCVVLGNPNNPTGRLIEEAVLRRIIDRCREKKALLVLDESFYDFLCEEDRARTFSAVCEIPECPKYSENTENPDPPEHLKAQKDLKYSEYVEHPGYQEHPKYPEYLRNRDVLDDAVVSGTSGIFVLRSFTKIYGMPGLRFGYGLCGDSGLLEKMRAVLQPWNVSLPAQAAAEQAAAELAFARESARLNRENRSWMARRMEEAGYQVFPSEANFLLFRGSENLKEYCLRQGFLIRDCSNFPGLGKGFFRVCVRSREENDALLQVLAAAKDM